MVQSSLIPNGNRPLASLARTGLESRFHSWLGVSGRRYICSVYPLADRTVFESRRAVVAAIHRDDSGLAHLVFVFRSDECQDFDAWARQAAAGGAQEWHVHLLAETPEAQASVTRDLSPALRLAA